MKKLVCALAATLSTAILSAPLYADDIAITGAAVIDGTGRAPLRDSTILVSGDRIISVGPRSQVVIPDGFSVIDAKGKYVIPGLMDANIHLMLDIRPESVLRYEDRYEDLIVEAAQVALKNGLTTVFDSWGPLDALKLARGKIDNEDIVGSRIYIAGNIVGMGGPFSPDLGVRSLSGVSNSTANRINNIWTQGVGPDLAWRSSEQVREIISDYLNTKEVDFLKYLLNDHQASNMIMFSPDVQQVFIEEAHKAGKIVQTHTNSIEGIRMGIELNVDLLQHCAATGPKDLMPPETIESLAKSGIACPVLAYTDRRLAWHQEKFPGNFWTNSLLIKDQNIRHMIKAGVNILMSTDAGIFADEAYDDWRLGGGYLGRPDDPIKIGKAHFLWFLAMEEKGMPPMEMLQSATQRVAAAYNMDNDLGTIEPGKIADVLILEKNPLRAARNYKTIEMVMKAGKIIDRDSLPENPILTMKNAGKN